MVGHRWLTHSQRLDGVASAHIAAGSGDEVEEPQSSGISYHLEHRRQLDGVGSWQNFLVEGRATCIHGCLY